MSPDLVVLEISDLQQLSFLHQGTTRLKIVCFDLCPSLILLGANSGTIYVLDHETLNLKTQIPTGSGSVVQLSISNDESLVACALSSGAVQVFELNVSGGDCGSGGAWRAVVGSREHESQVVSSLAWENTNAEVYIADTSGRVSVLYVTRSKTASLFRSSSVHLMTLESGVTSLIFGDGYLLVSTLTRSYICNTSLETFCQVGTRLRQGEYGGCFCRVAPVGDGGSEAAMITQQDFLERVEDARIIEKSLTERQVLAECYEAIEEEQVAQGSQSSKMKEEKTGNVATGWPNSRVFCARPGTRIWEANHSGKVLVTHQFKSVLMVPPADVFLTDGSFGEQELLKEILSLPETEPIKAYDHGAVRSHGGKQVPELNTNGPIANRRGLPGPMHPPVSVAFTKMLSFYSHYLLAISNYGLYIIDPANSKILLWINISDSVTDIKVSGNSMIFLTGSGYIKNFMVTTVDVAILFLHSRNLLVECAHLCLQNQDIFSNSELLCRLGAKLLSDLSHFIQNDVIKARLNRLRSIANLDKAKKTKLPQTGIMVVRNNNYENEEIKEGLMSALNMSHPSVARMAVGRWYSEPMLRGRQEKGTERQRYMVSMENSPVHRSQSHRHGSSTSAFLYKASSYRSMTPFSSEDALQSHTSEKSHKASLSSGKKISTEADDDRKCDNLTLSSGRCSQEFDSRSSHESAESLDMYENPLFHLDDSSPDQEMTSRAIYGDHLLNSHGTAHNVYNLAHDPIHLGSEAASLLQDLVENVTTNTSSTKSLTEKLKSVTPLMPPGEKSFKKSPDGPHSVVDDLRLNNASPNSDGTDDLESIVVRSSSKKKHRSSTYRAAPLTNKSLTNPPADEAQWPTQEIPGVVRKLHHLVTSTVGRINNSDNRVETCSLLKHWFEIYCCTVHQIQASNKCISSPQATEEVSGDGPVSWSSIDSSLSVASAGTSCDSLDGDSNDISFEPSAMSANSLEQITKMFLQCLQAGVYISDFHNPHIVYGNQKLDLQHSLTPGDIQKCDSLYAQLIRSDCGLLQYSYLLNELDTLGHNYYILTWAALLEKITKDMDVVAHVHSLPDIIPNLDSTRSQWLSLLYKIASAGNMKKFVTSATQIESSLVIEDVIFLLNYVAQLSGMEETVTKAQIPKLLLQYLSEYSRQKNLLHPYLTSWRHCPELQYDILNALVCEVNPSTYSCRCGMPRPGARPVALEILARTLLTHHLVDPKSMAALCQSVGYWEGYCVINLNYSLESSEQSFLYVLQTCDPELIEDFVEASHPHTYSLVLAGLANITCKDPSLIKCCKCQNTLPLSTSSHFPCDKTHYYNNRFLVNGNFPVSEQSPRDFSDQVECGAAADECREEEEEVPEKRKGSSSIRSMVELWEMVVVQLLRRCGAPHTLFLLKLVQDNIPPGILSSRVYGWCVLASLAEKKGVSARWALVHSFTNTPPTRTYSRRVAKSLFRDNNVSSKVSQRVRCSALPAHNSEYIENADQDQDSALPHSDNAPPIPPPSDRSSCPPSFFGHHWGVQSEVLQELCYCCHLGLATDALVREGGIIVFPCSHAFHAICISHRGHHCVVCAEDKPLM